MLVFNINMPLLRFLNKSLVRYQFRRYYIKQIDTVAKRGSMLEELVRNRDKRKNWELTIVPSKPKARMFDKVHKPHRRRAVLNALFISNITDVLSTGEICTEISKYSIEITGVQVSPCFGILNVFWQVRTNEYDSCEDIEKILAIAAPRIRAELISRNVLGKVPVINFLRDCTNARIAAFEEALQKIELEPKDDSSIVPDDSFTKNIFEFKDSKVSPDLQAEVKKVEEQKVEIKQEIPRIPKNPLDMKCNVFDLNHNTMMEKVLAMKKRKSNVSGNESSAVVIPESLKSADDLFSKIPGIRFKVGDTSKLNLKTREAIIKKFHIERKMLKEKGKIANTTEEHEYYEVEVENKEIMESRYYDDDFLEDEATDNITK